MVSFDVFNTLISYKTGTPEGIYAIMQSELVYNSDFISLPADIRYNFYYLRINAEEIARLSQRNSGYEEIRIDQIYSALAKCGNLSLSDQHRLIDLERSICERNLFLIPKALKKLQTHISQKEKVILIADTYFDEITIRNWLIKLDNIFKNLPLYCTSEYMLSKWSGRLYEYIREHEKENFCTWLHYGDHNNDDIKVAEWKGFKATKIEPERLAPYERLILENNEDNAALQGYIGIARYVRTIEQNPIKRMGITVGGPILLPYIHWVIEEAIRLKFHDLYFIARDGYVLKKIADIIIKKQGFNIKTHYLFGSRRAWRLASAVTDDDVRQVFNWMSFDNITNINELAIYLDMDTEDLQQFITHIDYNLYTSGNIKKIVLNLLDNKEFTNIVLARQAKNRYKIIKYMQQNIDFQANNFAFVDLTGTGYTQGCLAKILRNIYDKKIYTFYMFILDRLDIVSNCTNAAYFPSAMKESYIVEALCRAPHGQTNGYYIADQKVIPLFEKTEGNKLIEYGINDFCNGIVQYVRACDMKDYTQIYRSVSRKIICKYMEYLNSDKDQEILTYIGEMPFGQSGFENTICKYAPQISSEQLKTIYLEHSRNELSKYYSGAAFGLSLIRSEKEVQIRIPIYQRYQNAFFDDIFNDIQKENISFIIEGNIQSNDFFICGTELFSYMVYEYLKTIGKKVYFNIPDKSKDFVDLILNIINPAKNQSDYKIIIASLNNKERERILEKLITFNIPYEKITWAIPNMQITNYKMKDTAIRKRRGNIMRKVPIVMASDENYLFFASVTIISMLENCDRSTFYEIYFLVSERFMQSKEDILENLLTKYDNFSIEYITVDENIFNNAKTTNYHVTVETYYRLIISEVLKEYDRCLYLDCDLIVNTDLNELLNIDMENCYIAGVLDNGMQCGKGSYYSKHSVELGFSDMHSYINAGVLVMNLALIRSDNMTDIFLKHMQRGYSIEDQDVLNVTCKEKIKYLPLYYNVFNAFYGTEELKNCKYYNKEEIKNVLDGNIKIIHYAGNTPKPWKSLKCKLGDNWWKYAAKSPETSLLSQIKEEVSMLEDQRSWKRLLEACREKKDIVIFGYSNIGRKVYLDLQKAGITQVRAFCDNDKEKQNEELYGLPVLGIEKLKRTLGKAFIINTSQRYAQAINRQLISNGITAEQIYTYRNKNISYYRSIDVKYYKDALKDIFLREYGTSQEFDRKGYDEILKELNNTNLSVQYQSLIKKYQLDSWLIKEPLISIVIPAYNAEKYLDICLSSVCSQTYTNIEILLLNDGSTDSTADICHRWCTEDNRIRYVEHANMGMGPTRNKGIRMASAEYITFIDSDDWVDKNYVKLLYDKLRQSGSPLCRCNFYMYDSSKDELLTDGVGRNADIYDAETYRCPNMWSNMMKKELLISNDIFMPAIPYEDLAIYPLLALLAKEVAVVDLPLYYYRINTGTSVMDKAENNKYYPNAIEYLIKGLRKFSLYEDNKKLIEKIAFNHMRGALYRLFPILPKDSYNDLRQNFESFWDKEFEGWRESCNTNQYWIWGSYNLSRIIANLPNIDVYNLAGKDMAFYFGFSSIISLMSLPSSEFMKHVACENKLRLNMVTKEIHRSFLAITPQKDDFLILDFLEERYKILTNGKSFITESDALMETDFDMTSVMETFNNIDDKFEVWKKNCQSFIKYITDKFQPDKIILVENRLCEFGKTRSGYKVKWDDVKKINDFLDKCYAYFKQKLHGIKVIQIPDDLAYTDLNSKYGDGPHYLNYLAHKKMAEELQILSR